MKRDKKKIIVSIKANGLQVHDLIIMIIVQ